MPKRDTPQIDIPLAGILPCDLVAALLDKTYRRIPKQGEVCPYSGLNRSALYELFKICKDGRHVIKTLSLAQKGEKNGTRLYSVGSVLRYLDSIAEAQAEKD